MTKKEQAQFEAKIKELLKPLSLSYKITVIEKLGKEFRQANNLEINDEINDFKKGIKRSV